MKRYILGISCYYHDSAACLICEGKIVGAAQEERFTRIKNDENFPVHTLKWLLSYYQIKWDEIEAIVYYEKPFLTFERLIENFLQYAPCGVRNFIAAIPIWTKKKLFLPNLITKELKQHFGKQEYPPIFYSEHHLSHAASAFYPSPFKQALIITIDGVGEWATTGVYRGDHEKITPLLEIDFPHSLGLFYSALTAFLGFKVNSGEYKVMGLAPYGQPIFCDLIMENLLTLHPDGSYSLNLKYFGHTYHQKSYTPALEALLGHAARSPESPLEQFHLDLAASLQMALERAILHLINAMAKKYPERQLCLAGGVALNCVANAKIFESTPFTDIWVQPAAGDAGGALGAAYAFYHLHQKNLRQITYPDGQANSSLGPQYSDDMIEAFLNERTLPLRRYDEEKLSSIVANRIANGEICGWFQGRMEFGPRALGNRSILGDPRVKEMQSSMNLKVKFRESFRPFAPIALRGDAEEIFEWHRPAYYMQFVAYLKEKWRFKPDINHKKIEERIHSIRSPYPGITHLDYSARIQTIEEDDRRPIAKLLKEFKKLTGAGILINTSFNIRGEPIVESPLDAYRCFHHTAIDFLVLGNFIIDRKDLILDPHPPNKQEVTLD